MKNYSFIIADTNFKVQFNTYTSFFSISKNNFFPHSKRKTYQCFSMKISIWGSCYSIFSFICMFCRSLFVLLYYFFWPLCCLFFCDIWILITPLVSSNSSNRINNKVIKLYHPSPFVNLLQ